MRLKTKGNVKSRKMKSGNKKSKEQQNKMKVNAFDRIKTLLQISLS